MPSNVRFVHAADLHLGAPFKGVDASDPRVRDALVASTHEALGRVVDLCVAERADFLVLSGDVYNSAEKSVHDQAAFRAQMRRLEEAGITAYVAHGNHDPADGWSAGLALPETVHVFRHDAVERVEHVRDGEAVAALYGRSFPTRKVTDDYAEGFRRADGEALAIGVLHTNVGSRPGYDDYAPATTDGLARAGMDYWALGHIHQPGRISDAPRAVYAGCSQGLSPAEAGPRGCFVVDAGPHGIDERFVETASVRWATATVDVSTAEGLDSLLAAVSAACDRLRAEANGRPAVARLSLEGRGPAHAVLARGDAFEWLLNELRAEQLDRDPWLWVDELRDNTRRAVDAAASAGGDGFDGVLVAVARRLEGDPARKRLEELLEGPMSRLAVKPEIDLDAGDVLVRARDLCLDLLLDEEGR